MYSQSMLRDFQDYLSERQCGLVIKAKYIDKNYPDITTEAQAAGQWFEYMCTGATPRNSGVIPEPVRIKSGDLNAMYKQLAAHVSNYHTWLTHRGITGQHGTVLQYDNLTGIADRTDIAGTQDIKTTGHINNKWDDYGWDGELTNKPAMFQAKFYTLIRWKLHGKILPFTFLVFASNSADWKIITVNFTEQTLESFYSEVKYLTMAFELEQEIGFTARPEYKRCLTCPLASACKHVALMPDEIVVNI